MNAILALIRNWPIARDDPDRAAKQSVVNDIGDAVEAELRKGRFEHVGDAADRVMLNIAKKSGRIQ